MDTRRAYPAIFYNGKNISTTVDMFLESFRYTDPASGESDSIALTLGDWDRKWISDWFPDKGATLAARILTHDWWRQGEMLQLVCGTFTLDEISFSGFPDVMTIGAVSTPASDAFKTTKRTKTWEEVLVRQMATDIADRYKLTLVYDAPAIRVSYVEQSETADSAFLETICSDYGLSLKVYSNKLVIFDRESYKQKPAVKTINRSAMLSYTFDTTLTGTYTGGELTYTTWDGEEITFCTGAGPRILKSNAQAHTATEARIKLNAAIKAANHSETTLSFTIMGQPDLVAGQNINITGLGKANGKYYIDKATHSVGEAYTTAFECSKVQ